MKECEICGKDGELLETIIDGKYTNACMDCVKINNAIVLSKPSEEKLKKVERIFSVRERLENASKIREKERLEKLKEMEKKQAFPDTISYKLRKAREKAGLSKEKLADELGLKPEDINKYESGEEPSEQILKRYSQFFKDEFKIKEDNSEEQEINFKDEKITLRDLFAKARSFFSGNQDKGRTRQEKREDKEKILKDVLNEKEKDLKEGNEEKIRIE